MPTLKDIYLKNARGLLLLGLVPLLLASALLFRPHPFITLLAGFAIGSCISMHGEVMRRRAELADSDDHIGKISKAVSAHCDAMGIYIKLNRKAMGEMHHAVQDLYAGMKIISSHVGIEDPCGGPG